MQAVARSSTVLNSGARSSVVLNIIHLAFVKYEHSEFIACWLIAMLSHTGGRFVNYF